MGVACDTADNCQSTAGEQHSNQQRQDSPVAAHWCGGRERKLQNKTERQFTAPPRQPPRIQDQACYVCLGHYTNIEKPKFDHDLNAMS